MLDAADPDTALHWHLSANHYPPVPRAMYPVAKAAIKKASAGKWDAFVALPLGVEHRRGPARRILGHHLARVSDVIEGWHLDAFLPDA